MQALVDGGAEGRLGQGEGFVAERNFALAVVLLVDLARAGFKPVGKCVERVADDRVKVRDSTVQTFLDHDHLPLGKMDHDCDARHHTVFLLACNGDSHMCGIIQPVLQPVEALTDVFFEGLCHLNLVTFNSNLHMRVSGKDLYREKSP